MRRVIQNLFSSNLANVLIDGYLSPDFVINRGVLQGSKLGPILFNIFINDLFNELQNSGLGAFIGPIHIPALGFADDIVLISDHPEKLQKLINKCQHWALHNGMSFKTSKCKVMVFNGPSNGLIFTLNKVKLKIVDTYKYLGIVLSSKYITNLFRHHYDKITEKSRIKSAILKRHGFHEDGLRLNTAIRLYKLVIRPVLEYCGQTLSYGRYRQRALGAEPNSFVRKLEHVQTQILKNLINCPRSTSPAIVRLFCGVEPLACRFDLLKLRYFWKTLKCRTDSITQKVLKYRKEKFLGFDKGFSHEVFNICSKYNLLHLWHGNEASYKNPLYAIKKIIVSQNLQKDLEIGKKKKCSFASIFLSNPKEYQKNYHLPEIFRQPNCFDTPNGRKRVVKTLLHPCSYEEKCSLCGIIYTDKLSHLLTSCQCVCGYRNEFFLKLNLYDFPKSQILACKENFLGLILEKKIWIKCLSKFLIDVDF